MEENELRKLLRRWIEVDETSDLEEAVDDALTNPLVLWGAIVNGTDIINDEQVEVGKQLTRLHDLYGVIEEGFRRQESEASDWREFLGGFVKSGEDDPDLDHWYTLFNPNSTDKERQTSAEFLAHEIWKGRIYSSNSKARTGIKRLQEQFIRMETLLATCVLIAFNDSADPQKIRIGQNWLSKDPKKVTPIEPVTLTRNLYQRWLAQRSRKYFEDRALEEYLEVEAEDDLRNLLDEPKPKSRKKKDKSSGKALGRNYVEDRIIDYLDGKEKEDLLDALHTAHLSPQQQEYLEHKLIAFQMDHDATETAAKAHACKVMGISGDHGRQIESQIRKKMKK